MPYGPFFRRVKQGRPLLTKLKSGQARTAKLEAGSTDVSLDLLFRGLFAVGGGLAYLEPR